MVDVMIFAMLIASAASLLVVSPRPAQREALRALRDDSETESCRRPERIPGNCRGNILSTPTLIML